MVAVCLASYGAVAPCAHPQKAQEPQSDRPYVLRQRVEEVLLYCSVVDRDGKPLKGLQRSNFAVQEDGKPVAISHFADEDVPVSLSLVLDRSNSMQAKRAAVDSAANAILDGSNVDDETSVSNFADSSYLDQELTNDLSKLRGAIANSSSVSGGTSLFDTVIVAANRLAKQAQRKKQVIVVLTDGRDNASEADLAAAIKRVQREDGPVIYVLGLLFDLPQSQARQSRKELSTLADDTGGVALFPARSDEVEQSARAIAEDIRHQYTLAFHPAKQAPSGSFHPIVVKVQSPRRGWLSIRTRKGYFRNEFPQSTDR